MGFCLAQSKAIFGLSDYETSTRNLTRGAGDELCHAHIIKGDVIGICSFAIVQSSPLNPSDQQLRSVNRRAVAQSLMNAKKIFLFAHFYQHALKTNRLAISRCCVRRVRSSTSMALISRREGKKLNTSFWKKKNIYTLFHFSNKSPRQRKLYESDKKTVNYTSRISGTATCERRKKSEVGFIGRSWRCLYAEDDGEVLE